MTKSVDISYILYLAARNLFVYLSTTAAPPSLATWHVCLKMNILLVLSLADLAYWMEKATMASTLWFYDNLRAEDSFSQSLTLIIKKLKLSVCIYVQANSLLHLLGAINKHIIVLLMQGQLSILFILLVFIFYTDCLCFHALSFRCILYLIFNDSSTILSIYSGQFQWAWSGQVSCKKLVYEAFCCKLVEK